MEMTLDQFNKLDDKLDTVITEACELRTEQALSRQELGQIREHLSKLNGRTGKNEDRLSLLETLLAEGRGAWKLAILVASIPASIIGAVALWIAQHSGGK